MKIKEKMERLRKERESYPVSEMSELEVLTKWAVEKLELSISQVRLLMSLGSPNCNPKDHSDAEKIRPFELNEIRGLGSNGLITLPVLYEDGLKGVKPIFVVDSAKYGSVKDKYWAMLTPNGKIEYQLMRELVEGRKGIKYDA